MESAGIPCPEAITLKQHVLVMSQIGIDGLYVITNKLTNKYTNTN